MKGRIKCRPVLKESYPATPEDQLRNLPEESVRIKIAQNLFEGIIFLLTSFGIEIDTAESSFRIKSMENIMDKIKRRGVGAPLRDLTGIRLIIDEGRKREAVEILQRAFPMTPAEFPDGKPNIRDYSIKKHNPHTLPEYSALHVNIAFKRGEFLDFAEVQIMTHAELEIYNNTREQYIKNRQNI